MGRDTRPGLQRRFLSPPVYLLVCCVYWIVECRYAARESREGSKRLRPTRLQPLDSVS